VEKRVISAKPDSAPHTENPDAAPAAPQSQSVEANSTGDADKAPSALVAGPPASAAAPLEASAPKELAAPKIIPAVSAKPAGPALTNAVSPDTSAAQPPKPAAPPGPSPARLFETKLREDLAGNPLASKVTMQTAGRNITLSGSLSLAEHRELLSHLHAVPNGVRVIDDIEYAEDANSNSAVPARSAAADTSVGWIWVRSNPMGARILVDGAETGLRTPTRLELQKGQHEVQLVRRGFGTAHRSVAVESGRTIQFTDTLSPE